MEEDIDRLVLSLLDSIDSYAAVQEVIAKRLADILYLLAREKFHVRGNSERPTLKCIQSETSLTVSNSRESCSFSKELSTLNHQKWSIFTDVKETNENDSEDFHLSTTLKEAKRLSQNLTSLTLEAVNIQIEMNHLLEKLFEDSPLSERKVQSDIRYHTSQDRLDEDEKL